MYNLPMPNLRTLLPLTAILALLVIGLFIGLYTSGPDIRRQPPDTIEGLLWPDPKQIQGFTTVDHQGKAFGLDNLLGKWTFLFPGFTHCPDVCPITLAILNEFYNYQVADNIQILFITVDPERDTTERLAEYIGYFNEKFIGIGGTIEQVRSLASQIGIAYMYEAPDNEGHYMVNHTSSVFLLDPQARLVSIFSFPQTPAGIRSRFSMIEAFIDEQADN